MTNAEKLAKDKDFMWAIAKLLDSNCNGRETCELCILDGACRLPPFIDCFSLMKWLESEADEDEAG